MKTPVLVTGPFDNIRSPDVRFLQESAGLGPLTVLLWDDESVQRMAAKPPKFPLAERLYFLKALRFVSEVLPVHQCSTHALAIPKSLPHCCWADISASAAQLRETFCREHGFRYHVFAPNELSGFPEISAEPGSGRKKVIVTGCYDWLHSGHVRFFEEISAYGDVYAVVGNDANIRRLKGAGHPLLSQDERRYMVGAIRYVTQALITSGEGWLDAEPEIQRLKPDIYAVNADGDRGGKREFCARHGIQYLVLERVPAPGLPKRSSTDLRGY